MGMTITGVDSAVARMRGVGDRAANLTPVWPMVSAEVADGMRSQFATAGAAGGRPWAPLSPRYLQWKVAHGFNPATLIKTGRMKATLDSSPLDIERTRRTSAEFGTSDPIMKYHHFGTRNMPQRRVVFWFQPMQSKVVGRIRAYIVSGRA